MRAVLLFVCLSAFAAAAHALEAKGFFSVQTDERGVDWIVDPQGQPFVVTSVSNVHWKPDMESYPDGECPYYNNVVKKQYNDDKEKWADDVVKQLRNFGFNTVGAWSAEEIYRRMPHIINLDIGFVNREGWNDYFDPSFAANVRADVERKVAGRQQSQLLIGYFMGNELHWGADFRTATPLLSSFLGLPSWQAGHQRAIQYLNERYGSLENMKAQCHDLAWANKWEDITGWQWPTSYVHNVPFPSEPCVSLEAEFVYIVAHQYFSVVSKAIRDADPNHLVFSVRTPGMGTDNRATAEKVWNAMRDTVDVATLNMYTYELAIDDAWGYPQLGAFYSWAKKPIIIGEFSFRGRDMDQWGMNSMPRVDDEWTKSWTVATQADRGRGYAHYLQTITWWPHIVGFNWFEYVDQPAKGRWQDRENSNFGMVNAEGTPYTPLTDAMTSTNNQWALRNSHANGIHLAAAPSHVRVYNQINGTRSSQ